MDTITGTIEQIIFSNADNGYTVFEISSDTGQMTCVGILHAANVGEYVRLTGDYVNHAVYGRQFAFSECVVTVETDEESMLRYLSSGAIKGVGPTLARRMIDAFGQNVFRVLEEEPELLSTVKGISERKAQEIASQVLDKQDIRKAMVFLQKYGISNNLAEKIYKEYGNELYRVIEENPYRLSEDIDGVGFRIADRIAGLGGIESDSQYRIKSGILYTLTSAVAEGHVYLPKEQLLQKARELLSVDENHIWLECENLSMDKKMIIRMADEEIRVYLNAFYYMEMNCARMLRDLDVIVENDTASLRKAVSMLGGSGDEELTDNQVEAVTNALANGVSVITGGPGTGKTTIINRIIKYLESHGEEFYLAAPTGRAAKRMTEATGYEASTIQRLLGLTFSQMPGRGYSYEHDEDNPLEVDAVIVDEMSMVDLPVFYALLKALMPGCRLIMVGDTNQLPSVGPGSVLKDIIASGCINVSELTQIFRQSEKSDIVKNAYRINSGKMPDLSNNSEDFFFLKRNDSNVILKNMITLIRDKLPPYVNATFYDIQVLTPKREGSLGVEELNPVLQKYLNPPDAGKREYDYGNTVFREGDKVMQIKNNYRIEWEILGKYDIPVENGLGVFNGDMGIIKSIDPISETMKVLYEENHLVTYPFSNLDELELAYAVTIHKSQGSEYPAIILPLISAPRPLLNRNILYTAVTRARKCVTILGSEDIIREMVENGNERERHTGLDRCIRTFFTEENEI